MFEVYCDVVFENSHFKFPTPVTYEMTIFRRLFVTLAVLLYSISHVYVKTL